MRPTGTPALQGREDVRHLASELGCQEGAASAKGSPGPQDTISHSTASCPGRLWYGA